MCVDADGPACMFSSGSLHARSYQYKPKDTGKPFSLVFELLVQANEFKNMYTLNILELIYHVYAIMQNLCWILNGLKALGYAIQAR